MNYYGDVRNKWAEFTWEDFEPAYKDLIDCNLSENNVLGWMGDWMIVRNAWFEIGQRHYVAANRDVTNGKGYSQFLSEVYPQIQLFEQAMKTKLVGVQNAPVELSIPRRNAQADLALFNEENIRLRAYEISLATSYNELIGNVSVDWDGKIITTYGLERELENPNRLSRELIWRIMMERLLLDSPSIGIYWRSLMRNRCEQAYQSGMGSYQAFRWKDMMRYDYSPADCRRFRQAIYKVVVPIACQILEERKRCLGVSSLRPWDLMVDPYGRPPLQPFREMYELEDGVWSMVGQVDPDLGVYFRLMICEGLLDLPNRVGKSPDVYCTSYPVSQRPYIATNAVGTQEDVQTLLHEAGHAFHEFEAYNQPFHWPPQMPLEFAEVASMSMELIGAHFLDRSGFYHTADALRARIENLERMIMLWPFAAVIDEFQEWAYQHPSQSENPDDCNRRWGELYSLYIPGVDWSGVEEILCTGWQRKLHIFQTPFYYIEYALAQLGAVQVWGNYMKYPERAISSYRNALGMAEMMNLPGLYRAAGARFAFDAHTLNRAVTLMTNTIEDLKERERSLAGHAGYL